MLRRRHRVHVWVMLLLLLWLLLQLLALLLLRRRWVGARLMIPLMMQRRVRAWVRGVVVRVTVRLLRWVHGCLRAGRLTVRANGRPSHRRVRWVPSWQRWRRQLALRGGRATYLHLRHLRDGGFDEFL
jgi:hypothetical protein